MENNNDTFSTCPDCGVVKINGQYHWSYALQVEKTNPHKPSMPVSSDEVYSKVCALAKRIGKGTRCINVQGKFNPSLTYDELPLKYIEELSN